MNQSFEVSNLARTALETNFVCDQGGRLICLNDPEKSLPPRMVMYGFETGNTFRLRNDVSETLRTKISDLLATEPNLSRSDSKPVHQKLYAELLNTEAPVEKQGNGATYVFPPKFEYAERTQLVCSDTPEGDRLVAELRTVGGFPADFIELGFRGVDNFWKPWCAAIHDKRIASIGFTARLGEHGAESGVVTVPDLRGRGFAADAVSGWAKHPDLQGKTLFYSLNQLNTSSRRVAERLNLEFVGASFMIT